MDTDGRDTDGRRAATELLEAEAVDAKFNTADAGVAAIWDTLQRRQVDFAIGKELAAYREGARWRRARTVLDVGTGNGYYLRRIAALFPEKSYCGIDTSRELVEIAAAEAAGTPNLEFRCHDVADEPGRYDFAIMRLLLQHLSDPQTMLEQVGLATAPGGAALVIDCWDAARTFAPDVPAFRGLFQAYTDHQATLGRRRDVVDRLPEMAAKSGLWEVADHRQVVVASSAPGQLALFEDIYGHFIDLVERTGEFDHPFDAVRREWRRWCALEGRYTQVGVNVVTLHRGA
jgi:SAM-dependent methyltransferase